MPHKQPRDRRRLHEQVAEQLSAWIVEQQMCAGDMLPAERKLAAQLGISRVTLSQALVVLELLGVVIVRHGVGTVVAKPMPVWPQQVYPPRIAFMFELMEIREALLIKIAGLAAERRTTTDIKRLNAALGSLLATQTCGDFVDAADEFYGAMTAATHNPLLVRLMTEIANLVNLEVRHRTFPDCGRSVNNYRELAYTVSDGDNVAAASQMLELIKNTVGLSGAAIEPSHTSSHTSAEGV